MSVNKVDRETWFSEWFPGTSADIIENKLNRGAMKIVLEFLIKRARRSEAIDVIRSNLYINEKRSKVTEPVEGGVSKGCHEKAELLDYLRKSESRLILEIERNMKKLYAIDATVSAFSSTMEKKLFISTMRENLAIINNFLENISEVKNKGSISSDERLETLNDLLEEALKIFQDIFSRRGFQEPKELDWSKIDKIIPSVLCSEDYALDIQRWNTANRKECENKVHKRVEEMSNSVLPNPLAEWDRLVTKKLYMWTECHIQLHWKNRNLLGIHKSLCAKKREGQLRAMDTCRHFLSLPPDFFNLLLHREELRSQLRRCREISNKNAISLWPTNALRIADIDSDSESKGVLERDRQISSAKGNLYKIAATEDMAVCLLKGWYNTKSRLLSTQDKVRQIFPEVLVPAVNALLNHSQPSYNYSSLNESSRSNQSNMRDLLSSSAINVKDSKTEDTSINTFEYRFPSAAMDLNLVISMQEELRCQSLKLGSSTTDVLQALLTNSASNSIGDM